MTEMTPQVLTASCKAHGGYAAPRLNDQLYLHCRGFMEMKNLEPYTNAKVLWLEQNAISEVQGLSGMQDSLVSLFLQNNTIGSLRSLRATPLHSLRVINLSHNYLTSLEGLAVGCPQLETLQVSHNMLASMTVCEDLWQLASTLTSVDLSHNRIEGYEPAPAAAASPEDSPALQLPPPPPPVPAPAAPSLAEGTVDGAEPAPAAVAAAGLSASGDAAEEKNLFTFFAKLPLVSVIYLQGNGIVRGMKQYRRTMILRLPALTYLDERPVFADERRITEAWAVGQEEETRAAIRAEKRDHLNSCVRVLSEKMASQREVRDRLTEQWERRREEEMAAMAQQRQRHREALAAVEAAEDAARGALERDESDGWIDLGDVFAEAHARASAAERDNWHAYEQAREVAEATAEAEREIAREEEKAAAAAAPLTRAAGWEAEQRQRASLADLLKSDDDVLCEMEEEIQLVLRGLDGGRGPVRHYDAATARAVGSTADRLRAERRASREDLWGRFDAWQRRGSSSTSLFD